MKRNAMAIKLSVILSPGAVLLMPVAACCAEAGSEPTGGGSWLSLLFYVVNFALFIWILVHFAGAPVLKFFADRADAINETNARAETALTEAQNLARRSAERMFLLGADKKRRTAHLDPEKGSIPKRDQRPAR